ncbi:hypothetical protein KA005_01870 [bacterium]|nr:hypothetical protein [bacterium]
MPIKIKSSKDVSQYIDIGDPTDKEIFILPNNFDLTKQEYCYSSTLPTIKKLAKEKNVLFRIIGDTEDQKLLEQRGQEWYGPVFLVGSLFYSQNSQMVSIALSMIANYLSNIFMGQKDVKAKMDVLVRNDEKKITKKVSYEGPVGGLTEVNDAIKSVMSEYGIKNKDTE